MMNARSYVWVALLLLAFVAVGCGGSDGSDTPVKDAGSESETEDEDEAESETVETVIGLPVSATANLLVIVDAKGEELRFNVREDDRAAVDPQHVGSHVNVPGIAFRIYYEESDGELYAVRSEEVSSDLLKSGE